MGIQVCLNEGQYPLLFQGEIIQNIEIYIDEIQKSSSPVPPSQFQPYLAQKSLGKRIQVFTNKKHLVLKYEI